MRGGDHPLEEAGGAVRKGPRGLAGRERCAQRAGGAAGGAAGVGAASAESGSGSPGCGGRPAGPPRWHLSAAGSSSPQTHRLPEPCRRRPQAQVPARAEVSAPRLSLSLRHSAWASLRNEFDATTQLDSWTSAKALSSMGLTVFWGAMLKSRSQLTRPCWFYHQDRGQRSWRKKIPKDIHPLWPLLVPFNQHNSGCISSLWQPSAFISLFCILTNMNFRITL
ncbi:uncharacterized protein LOC122422004 [Cervus canadensis]|uniref:uncharacterized protein LOC122422004 n=1 Tax=Cervus canadensis TaxID=1574408 RepID=UPI001CA336E4|nr:uncharacterized protein LOC122422004 [Cervus canadensis]